MASVPKDLGLQSDEGVISHILDTLSSLLGTSLDHISPQAVLQQDPTATRHFFELCHELDLVESSDLSQKDESEVEEDLAFSGLQSNSHNNNCDRDIVRAVKRLLKKHGCGCRVERAEDISDKVLVRLYEMVTGNKLEGVIRNAVSKRDKVGNVRLVVESLESNVLDTSLSHICPRDIVNGDIMPLRYIVEIFHELDSYKKREDDGENRRSPRRCPCKQNPFDMDNCRRILEKYKVTLCQDVDMDVSSDEAPDKCDEAPEEKCEEVPEKKCSCVEVEPPQQPEKECPCEPVRTPSKKDCKKSPFVKEHGNLLDKGLLLPYLITVYPDLCLRRSATEVLCRPVEKHKARTDMLVKRRKKRMMQKSCDVRCGGAGRAPQKPCKEFVRAVARRCARENRNRSRTERRTSDGNKCCNKCEAGNKCFSDEEEADCWKEGKANAKKMILKFQRFQKPQHTQDAMQCLVECLKEKGSDECHKHQNKQQLQEQTDQICSIEN